jgi:hypothetical protein
MPRLFDLTEIDFEPPPRCPRCDGPRPALVYCPRQLCADCCINSPTTCNKHLGVEQDRVLRELMSSPARRAARRRQSGPLPLRSPHHHHHRLRNQSLGHIARPQFVIDAPRPQLIIDAPQVDLTKIDAKHKLTFEFRGEVRVSFPLCFHI